MLTDGLKLAIADLEKVEFQMPESGARVGKFDKPSDVDDNDYCCSAMDT